jgi:protein-disulfide isomerase
MEAEVMKDLEDGQKHGVSGTPAFFINGIFLNGAQPYEKFKAIIDRELAKKG